MELVIPECLVGHDVRAPAVVAAEQGRGRRASRTYGEKLAGIGRVHPNFVANDPYLLGIRIAVLPACEIFAVEQRFPAVPAGVLLRGRLRRGSRDGCRAGEKCQHDYRADSGIP